MTDRAVTALAEQHIEADDEVEQLGLFAAPLTDGGIARGGSARRGPGRPPGARNRRTERTIAFLLSRHRDPRQVLLEIAEANIFDLAALLGCTPAEAMTEKRLAAIGVLPYVAARITPEVIKQFNGVFLTIHEGGSGLGERGQGTAEVLDHVRFEIVDTAAAEMPSAETSDVSEG